MTEDDAKTRACCGPRNNVDAADGSDVLCIASSCMAWRSRNSRVPDTQALRADDGYCGLAGAPP